MRSPAAEHPITWVKDLSPRPRSPEVATDHGLGYELVLSLRMWADVEDPTSYSAGRPWFDRVRRVAPASLLRDVDRYCGGHELLFGHLLGVVIDARAPRDPARVIEHVERMGASRLRRHLLGYHLQTYRGGVSPAVIARAATGDPEAEAALLAGSDDEHAGAYRHILEQAPDETHEALLSVLEGWNDHVMGSEELPEGILARGASTADRLAGELPLDRALDLLAPGCTYEPEPGIDRVLLIPSWVGRPWLVMCEHRATKIFCFPVNEDQAWNVDAPPPGLARVFRALGDDSRLRVLRLLTGGDRTLQELTDHLGLAKSTVHAHLLTLRTSRLVSLDVTDRRYSARAGALDEATALAEGYLEVNDP